MNDLFSGSFSRFRDGSAAEYDEEANRGGGNRGRSVEMSSAGRGANLDKFFEDVEGIKDELRELEKVQVRLEEGNESSKTLHNAKAVKELRARMDADAEQALKRAKVIKVKLEALDRANAANRGLPGCGPGSSSDRTRTSVVAGLRKKSKESMDKFRSLRDRIAGDYKDTVRRRYYTVTGETPDEGTVEALISTGESETFLQKAIRDQGRGRILDTISEIQERHDAVKDVERNLLELHQVFMDMAVLVEAQGEQLDDIESHVARANSFVRGGTNQLQEARKRQKNTRKWTCFAIILLIIIILVILLPIILSNRK